MKVKSEILLIFLLLNWDIIKSKINDTTKKIECLFIEKKLSIENESISPVKPKDIMSIKFNLSTDVHQLIKYLMI